MSISNMVDFISAGIAKRTVRFVQTGIGKIFLSFVLVGPLTFLPTVYVAWTAPNIDVLRTWTWPLMIMVNTSALLGVVHNGDWRMRLVMFVWVLMMVGVYVAILVR